MFKVIFLTTAIFFSSSIALALPKEFSAWVDPIVVNEYEAEIRQKNLQEAQKPDPKREQRERKEEKRLQRERERRAIDNAEALLREAEKKRRADAEEARVKAKEARTRRGHLEELAVAWDREERSKAEYFRLVDLSYIEYTMEPILQILEMKKAGLTRFKVGGHLLTELLEICQQFPMGDSKKTTLLWSLERKATEIQKELGNLNMDKPSPEALVKIVSQLNTQNRSPQSSSIRIDARVVRLIENRFVHHRHWVELKGVQLSAAYFFAGFQTGLMSGVVTNSLGKRYWSLCPTGSFSEGIGATASFLHLCGQVDDAKASIDSNGSSSGAAIYFPNKISLKTQAQSIEGKEHAVGAGYVKVHRGGIRPYKVRSLSRDYTYLRRRLGMTYLDLPEELKEAAESSITPLPMGPS